MGQWGWVGQWVGSGQITNYRINLDLIGIIQFCVDGLMCGWLDGWVRRFVGYVKSLKIESILT